jgi:hypothetical protein
MGIRKDEYKFLSARKLRAIASGEYKGILSSEKERRLAKKELNRRGLKSGSTRKKKKKSPLDIDVGDIFQI